MNARSSTLRVSDVRGVVRLVSECRDLGDDGAEWWTHLSRGLSGLIDADFAGCGEVGDLRPDGGATTLGIGEWGWQNGFDREPWDWSVTQFDKDPAYSEPYRLFFARLAADPGACVARTDLMSEVEWTASVSFQKVNEPMGAGYHLWCFHELPQGPAGQWGAMTLARLAGRPDFTGREKVIVRETLAAIAALVGGPLSRFREPSPAALPPRGRLVLKCLLEGDSDKQIASRLEVSPHTVNGYTKTIYKHFGVTSRPELLARWVKRGWGARFAWADE